jgi:hypothetical protein
MYAKLKVWIHEGAAYRKGTGHGMKAELCQFCRFYELPTAKQIQGPVPLNLNVSVQFHPDSRALHIKFPDSQSIGIALQPGYKFVYYKKL